ncbi:undecaprenyldiphospho-muramoylpentapeptide beta-N-acetylglucosaminyltransferase [Enterobacteriaceae endosymbiont of Macroplea mutica]|uniref:undecaprenyldiphospho-muramoylpentapeptide beta-N-acetylglucosaminyltransferase n=1 Tax=Enterobacteriaceae endosymbiont of Macroplea mutica TaxID=2675791 RepID=UPI001449E909|nr:undecaprenyldiphospho-muramoylpentapeptide beta-N-acetylglucosaminyltransferase [Enterobacteriaceae endosymbiont of Macroplea mutica]QJC31180.1 undecaprenyldiphospho-muramoylpentapeptide beta-N-acetylglucosaminyltransferase [Enterobacteriaceae endosymbiont of Macroplea mutica]
MKKKILIVAGGTGGHIYPALNIASKLITQGWEVRWLGSANRMEEYIIPARGIKIYLMNFSKSKKINFFSKIWIIVTLCKIIFQSLKIYQHYKPNIVLTMGSYITGPSGIAAWLYRIPLIIHEQNSIAGHTNKILSYFAMKTLIAYPNTFQKAILVGNPINHNIIQLSIYKRSIVKIHTPIRLLITGGSQGSKVINNIGVQIAHILKNKVSILHQVGYDNIITVLDQYKKNTVNNVVVKSHIQNMYKAYKWADIIICRSGAMTVSEIIAIGLPAIFIPYPHKDRQQYYNAVKLQKIGIATIFEQNNIDIKQIIHIILSLNKKKILKTLAQTYKLFIYNSLNLICNEINNVLY